MREFSAGSYDVAVIGAGHAGIEAALACERLGMKTAGSFIKHYRGKNMPHLIYAVSKEDWAASNQTPPAPESA